MNINQAILLILLSAPITALGGDFARDFTVVFITSATEAKYGNFPLDRPLIAQAIEKAASAGAKGVILKFFFDQSRTAEGDRHLATALSRVPVLLEARIDDSEKRPNPLEGRFTLPASGFKAAISGNSGWIPLPELSKQAHDVCFVDFASSPAPIIEMYQGKIVKSLLVCATELATGQKAVIHPGKDISIADQTAYLDSLNRVTIALGHEMLLTTFDFNSLLDGSIPLTALRNKVVIIGYDGASIQQMKSPAGTMGIHRLFSLMLKGFYESMAPNEAVGK